MNWRNDLLHWGTPFLLAASSEALNVLQGDSAITWQAAVRAVLMAGLGAVLVAAKKDLPAGLPNAEQH